MEPGQKFHTCQGDLLLGNQPILHVVQWKTEFQTGSMEARDITKGRKSLRVTTDAPCFDELRLRLPAPGCIASGTLCHYRGLQYKNKVVAWRKMS